MAKSKKPRGTSKRKPEALEDRILLSATWSDADTGGAQEGATAGDDIASGSAGDDVLDGLGGNDDLFGDAGNDLLAGGAGDDAIDGGSGVDTADYSSAASAVTVDITLDGQAQDTGGAGQDTLTSIEGVKGSAHDDTFVFSSPADGATYGVDGGGGSNTVDLSQFSASDATVTASSIEVSTDSVSFTIEYETVDSIAFSDGAHDVADVIVETPAEMGLPDSVDTDASVDARNPVAHFTFEGDGVTDRVGDATGSYSGDARVADTDGRSVVFDGTGDYVEIPHSSALELDSGTIEFSFRTDDASQRQGILSKDSTGYDQGGHFTVWVDDGGIEVRLQSDDASHWVRADGVVSSNEWTNVQVSFGDGGLHLFVDGQLADSDSYTGGLGASSGGTGNTEPIVLGANAWQSGDGAANNLQEHFSGEIADVAFLADQLDVPSAADLSPAEVGLPADSGVVSTTAKPLVAHWTFDGTTVTDQVGSSDGTLSNGAAQGDSAGRSAVFDGSNDYAVLQHSDDLLLDEGRIEMRFNSDDVSSRQGLFSKDSSGYDDGGHLTAYIDNGKVEVRFQSTSASYTLTSDAVLQDGAWHDVAFEFGDNGMKLFVDGVEQDTNAYTGGLGSTSGGSGNTEPIVLGANQWSSGDGVANSLRDHFSGRIADVAVYGGDPYSGDDVFTVGTPVDGQAFSFDGSTGSDTIDLSAFSSENATFAEGSITVGLDDGGFFTVDHDNVEFVTFSDATAVVVDGDVDTTATRPTIVVDGAVATLVDPGSGSLGLSYDAATDTLDIVAAGGDGASVDIDVVQGAGATIGTIDVRGDIGGITSEADIGTINIDAMADIGTISVGGGSGSIDDVVFEAGENVNASALTIDADVGSISAQELQTDITIDGDVGSLSVVDDLTENATITINGDASSISIGDDIWKNADLAITGHVDSLQIGGEIQNGSTLVVGSAETIEVRHVAGGSITVGGDLGTFRTTGTGSNADLRGTLTIGGDAGTIDIADDIEADISVGGDLGTLTMGDDIKGGADVTVGGDADEIRSPGGIMSGSTVTVNAASGPFTIQSGGVTLERTYDVPRTIVFTGGENTLTESNLAPTGIGFSGGTIAENTPAGTLVATASAVDADAGDTHTYELVDDAGGLFVIDSDTGEITNTATLDHESQSSYSVTVRATDASGESVEQLLAVAVGDVNEAPDGLVITGGSVAENSPVGTVVAQASANDVDGDALTYSLSDDAGGRFSIDSSTGEITVSGELDHESAGQHEITVVATDPSGESVEQSLTVAVGDVNEVPEDLSVTVSSVREDAAVGTFVGNAAATDPDAGDVVSYSLADDAGGRFAIDPVSGEITVASELDHDAAQSHTLTVVATDGDGETLEIPVTIEVAENAAPAINAGDDIEIEEGEPVTLRATISPAMGQPIDFEAASIDSYGGNQDTALDVSASGTTIDMRGDGWKSIEFPISVNADTVIEFEFRSDSEGEIHGIGFSNDRSVSSADRPYTFEVHGTQDWGTDASSYATPMGDGWVSYRIPVGEHFTGDFDRLVLVNDHDVASPTAHSEFRNMRISDSATPVGGDDASPTVTWRQVSGPAVELDDASSLTPTFDAPEVAQDQEIVFEVTVDTGDSTSTDRVTVNVLQTNDAPDAMTFTGGSVAENSPVGTVVAQARANDGDGDVLTYPLADDAAGRFTIDSATGEITVAGELDHESAGEHEITVVATDPDGESIEQDLVVTVADVNEQPFGLSFFEPGAEPGEPASYGFEDAEIGSNPASLSFSNGITAEITQDNVLNSLIVEGTDGYGAIATEGDRFWKIRGGETMLSFDQPVAEVSFEYSDFDGWSDIRVRAGDQDIQITERSSNAEETLVVRTANGEPFSELSIEWLDNRRDGLGIDHITVTPATVSVSGVEVVENAPAGTVVASARASDADAGDALAYSLTDDAGGRFTIDPATGAISVSGELDHEAAASHSLTVQVTDGAGNTDSADLTVSIADVNETPDGLVITGGSVAENSPVGTVVGQASANDADGDTLTYSLSDDADGRFSIDASTGEITVSDELDHESAGEHEITVVATDPSGESIEQGLTVTVGDVNETPDALVITGGSVAENSPIGTVVGQASATDVDGDVLTYSLSDDADGRFAIDPQTGEITVAGELDHESASSHEISVVATDPSGESVEQALTVTVGDVNEAPDGLVITGGSVAENSPIGSVVAHASASDIDGDALTYSLSKDAGGRFSINPSTGEITVAGQLDHESSGLHEITVVATDPSGESIKQGLTVTVGDVNEVPDALVITGGSVTENSPIGTVVGQASASDVDGDALTYSLLDDAGGRFAIDPQTGEITVAGELDHESAGSHRVTVVASDPSGESIEQGLTIRVGDVNEAPASLVIFGGFVAKNSPVGTVVGVASAADVDGDALTYSLPDDAGGRFAIDPQTGEITVAGNLDHESSSSHEITVVATDGAGETVERSMTVAVGNVNEGPESLRITGGTVAENSPIGTVVAQASATDADGDELTYSLTQDADGRFAIDAETGEITVAGFLDHEAAGQHTVTVMATDPSGETIEQQLTVTVEDVGEAIVLPSWTGEEELAILDARDDVAGLVELTDDALADADPQPVGPPPVDAQSVETIDFSEAPSGETFSLPDLPEDTVPVQTLELMPLTSSVGESGVSDAERPSEASLTPAPADSAGGPEAEESGNKAADGFLGKMALLFRGVATRLPGNRRDD